MVVTEVSDRNTWNRFLETHDGPVYNHWGWNEAVAGYGHDQWRLGVRDEESGDLAAILPLAYIDSRLFGSQLLSPAFAERGSIVVDTDADVQTAIDLLLDQSAGMATDLGADLVGLRGSIIPEPKTYTTNRQYVTFQVDVGQGVDGVWDGIKESRQRQVDQAGDTAEITYARGTDVDDLAEYYRLYLATMRGHGSPPHSWRFFETLWEELYPDGHFHLHLVRYDGSLINAMIDLSMGSTVYQWGVVSDYEQRDLNGGSLVLWRALDAAVDAGYDTYEFGRTREGTGVYMFKKSFGGEKVWYDDLYYGTQEPTTPDPTEGPYQHAQAVWRRLPLPVTRIIGPHIRKRIGI